MQQPPTRDDRSAEARRLLEGINGPWVAERLEVSDATVGAWRRGDRVPDLGELLAIAIAVGRPLSDDLYELVESMLAAGRLAIRPGPAVLEEAAEEAEEVADAVEEPRQGGGVGPAERARRGASPA